MIPGLTDICAEIGRLSPAKRAALDCVKINRLEAALADAPRRDCPVKHRFTQGLYIRECFVPAGDDGTIVTSKIHLTEHPFVLLSGRVSVWQEEMGWVEYRAPYVGITKPQTRRVLFVHEDIVWVTFHPTTETDVQKIEDTIILKHDFQPAINQGQKCLG